MFCKWCGLESDTADVCSWCGRPFASSAQKAATPPTEVEPTAAKPQPLPQTRGVADVLAPGEAISTVPEPDLTVGPIPGAVQEAAPAETEEDFEGLDTLPFSAPLEEEIAAPVAWPPQPAQPAYREPPESQPPPPRPSEPPQQRPVTPAPAPKPVMETIPVRKPSVPSDTVPPPTPQASPPPTPPLEPTTPRPGPIPVRSQTGPAPIPVRPTAPPAATPPSVQPPVRPRPAVGPPIAEPPTPDVTSVEPGVPPLDLPPRLDEPEEIVAPAPGRLDLTEAPSVELPPPRKPAPGPLPTFARPIPQTTVEIPKAGGRTWYCRWCGMESETPDRCSWCRRDLRNLPAGGQSSGRGPVIAGEHKQVVRVPRAGERQPKDGKSARPPVPAPTPPAAAQPAPPPQPVRPVTTASAGGAAAAAAPAIQPGVPAFGTFRAQKSKYYPDQVVDPVSGRHFDAETGQTTDTPTEMKEDVLLDERAALIRQSGIYLAGLAAAIVLFSFAARLLPQWYLAFIAALNIAAGMAMPPLGVVPYGEDDSSDVAFALPLILVLGPIVGGMAYGVIALMRQDANPAIVGIFVTYLLIRFPLQFAAGAGVAESLQSLVPFSPPPDGNWGAHLALQWLPFATVIGWYMASFFHKPDE